MSKETSPRELGYYAALAQTGFEMVLPAVAGHWVDGWLDTSPWFTIGAAVFGFAGGMTHLILILRQKEREESKENKPPS